MYQDKDWKEMTVDELVGYFVAYRAMSHKYKWVIDAIKAIEKRAYNLGRQEGVKNADKVENYILSRHPSY